MRFLPVTVVKKLWLQNMFHALFFFVEDVGQISHATKAVNHQLIFLKEAERKKINFTKQKFKCLKFLPTSVT